MIDGFITGLVHFHLYYNFATLLNNVMCINQYNHIEVMETIKVRKLWKLANTFVVKTL